MLLHGMGRFNSLIMGMKIESNRDVKIIVNVMRKLTYDAAAFNVNRQRDWDIVNIDGDQCGIDHVYISHTVDDRHSVAANKP
jgi:hypothetical protein